MLTQMYINMKKIIVILTTAILFISCNKDTYQYKDAGEITGADLRLCPGPCCGGWIIKIKETFYFFGELPSGSGIDLQTAKFPVKVKLDWSLIPGSCNDSRITISKIKKI
jgi:hypothetical protein